MRCVRAAVVLALLAGAGRPAGAAPGGAGASGDVPVYTNADLSRFGPASTVPSGPVVESAAGWSEIQAFLEREYGRIDADRRHHLELLESERLDRLARVADAGAAPNWSSPRSWASPYFRDYAGPGMARVGGCRGGEKAAGRARGGVKNANGRRIPRR